MAERPAPFRHSASFRELYKKHKNNTEEAVEGECVREEADWLGRR